MSKNDLTPSNEDATTPLARMLFGWTSKKWTPTFFLVVIGLLALILFVWDFMIDRHAYKPVAFSEMSTFYALYGFGAFTLVVLCGWPLGRMLRRPEDHYGDETGEAAHIRDGDDDQEEAR